MSPPARDKIDDAMKELDGGQKCTCFGLGRSRCEPDCPSLFSNKIKPVNNASTSDRVSSLLPTLVHYFWLLPKPHLRIQT